MKKGIYFCKECGTKIENEGEYIPNLNFICVSCYSYYKNKTKGTFLSKYNNLKDIIIKINDDNVLKIDIDNDGIKKPIKQVKLLSCPTGTIGKRLDERIGCCKD